MGGLELFLALRYLRGGRQALGGALTSVVAVGGVTVGVAALIATLGVMTGFREDIRAKILGVQPHLILQGAGPLPDRDWSEVFRGIPEVTAWSPFIMDQVLIKKGPVTQGVLLKGVDAAREGGVTGLSAHVQAGGDWTALSGIGGKAPGIVLGKELARSLDARPGDAVLLAVSRGGAVAGMPTLFQVEVAGIVETGLYDYDSSLAVMGLGPVRRLFQQPDRVDAVGVRLKNPEDFAAPLKAIQARVGESIGVRSWLAMNHNLFSALQLEKAVMFLILTLITLVAAFTILSNLILVTAQKTREIGILRAMGATRGVILRIFLYKGLLMGTSGAVAGGSLGLAISWAIRKYQFVHLPAGVYYVDRIPVTILPSDVAAVMAAAFVIVLAATLYPARAASRLDALTAIRS
jgi:lipoprotein-releasing system permease protein